MFLSFPFLAQPATNVWPLAFVALVPLLFVLEDAKPKRGFWLGWLVGFVTNMGGFWWISHVLGSFGQMPAAVAWSLAALNAAYQGLQFAIFGWLFCKLRPADGARHSILRVAMIYTAIEFVFPMIFPWYYANSQYRFLPIIQLADLAGVSGVTFVLLLFNGAVYETIRFKWLGKKLDRKRLYIGYGAAVVAILYGLVRIAQVEADMAQAETLRIGLVEANIGIIGDEVKAHPGVPAGVLMHSHTLRHQRLSQQLDKEGVDLIVWPESSYMPQGRMHVKRQPDFAIGVSDTGRLIAWRDLHPEPFAWVVDETESLGALRAVASVREDVFYAVGDKGLIVSNESGEIRPIETTSRRHHLLALALGNASYSPANHSAAKIALWAVGEGGTLLAPRFKRTSDGRNIEVSNARLDRVQTHGGRPWPTGSFRSIAMQDAMTGIAVGDGGTVIAIGVAADAADLAGGFRVLPRVLPVKTSADLHAVVSLGAGAYLMAGAGGEVWHLGRGNTWTREKTPKPVTLRALTSHQGVVWAVGDGGTVLVRGREGVWKSLGESLDEDLIAVTVDPVGRLLVSGLAGGMWLRRGAEWHRLEASGLGVVRGLAPLGYALAKAMPRGTRYIRQGDRPPPHEADFVKKPTLEPGRLFGVNENAVQRGFKTPILYGGITWEGDLKYNTAILLDDFGRVVDTYDKNYLLVFGEYIPLGDRFPELYETFPSGRFEAGTDVKVFDFKGHRIGVMICYEDILPRFTRRLADKDPEVIINVTNDAWFGKNGEPYLHLALAAFRSIESRVSLLRSTNTGVSAVISPIGELVQQTSLEGEEVMVSEVPMMSGGTVYTQVGDAFAYFLWVWLALVALRQKLAGRAERPGNRATPAAPCA